MSERIGFRIEMVPVEGGGKEGRLVANASPEANARFVQGVFRRFGQSRAAPGASGSPAASSGSQTNERDGR